jgi:NAD(P)H-flavin reductase
MPKLAVLEERIAETKDTCSMKFRIKDSEKYCFSPGQFNMLGVEGYGEMPVSFSSLSINDNSFIHTIRLAGNVTKAICKIPLNKPITIRGPYGYGWPVEKALDKHVFIVAGGIGMAPLRPLVYHFLKNKNKFKKLFLLYGSKTEDDIIYRKELKKWQESGDITVLLSVDEKPVKKQFDLHVGVITELLNKIDVPLSEGVTFTCGPEIMMRFVAGELMLNGHSGDDIYVSMERRMKCGIAHCGHCQIGVKYVCKDGPVFSYTDIKRFADILL